ncbi:MAG: hypothetical protein RIS35_1525 [Pseudomonadota bacterium]|jgi:TRAP-type uncharacterized transport system substrate-binding protein
MTAFRLPRSLVVALQAMRDLLVAFGPLALIGAGLLVAAYHYLQPMPPKVVTLATGQEQDAYAEFGRRYAAWFAAHGIEVRLRETQGAAENLALLRDPASGVDVAFMQGGADSVARLPGEAKDDGLVAIAGLYHEPVWIFYREASARRTLGRPGLSTLAELQGWRVNVGTDGSGAPNLMSRLLEDNRIAPGAIAQHRLGHTDAVMALLAGRLDAVVFVSGPEAPMVQMLLMTPGVRLFDFAQAQAYARRHPFMEPVTLQRGIVDLAADRPPRDVRLVAPTAMLLAREDTHPALVQLFARAAAAIHGEAGWFRARGEFPSGRALDWPQSPEAERALTGGIPLLQRWLPFWLANLVERMWVVLLSILALLLPLAKVVPPLYEFRVRSRIFRWYGELRRIEESIGEASENAKPSDSGRGGSSEGSPGRGELLRRLDALDARVERIAVPLSHADELYALRAHIQMVRGKLGAA